MILILNKKKSIIIYALWHELIFFIQLLLFKLDNQ